MIIVALIALSAAIFHKKNLYIVAFVGALIILAARVVILERAPVATLGETALFVAALLLAISFYAKKADRLLALLAAFLLFIAPLSNDPIQPVLRSNFWLTIHVLTIVSSYAFLLGASALAHILLIKRANARALERLLSIGTILLIIGTLLGGIWASQSWGRFWDWDPKETWAFVSAALYLIGLHAYRLGKMGSFGLSLFAIIAGASITFTWYGLNVLVTRGLHSYGFTQAPLFPYLAFLLGELLFCGYFLGKKLFAKKE